MEFTNYRYFNNRSSCDRCIYSIKKKGNQFHGDRSAAGEPAACLMGDVGMIPDSAILKNRFLSGPPAES